MREKLVECYGRKQMLQRNYASRDNHLRQHCVCWGVNSGRELVRELNKCIDLHRFTFQTTVYDQHTHLQTYTYTHTYRHAQGLTFILLMLIPFIKLFPLTHNILRSPSWKHREVHVAVDLHSIMKMRRIFKGRNTHISIKTRPCMLQTLDNLS